MTDRSEKIAGGALATPTDLGSKARQEVAEGMNRLLADTFALYVKCKNFHWHVSGPHFRSYHLLLDEQATAIYGMLDPIAERVRKLGGMTIRSIGHIGKLQRIKDNDADFVEATAMLDELRADNQALVKSMREVHELCDKDNDIATASLLENWIDEAEERIWFLYESTRS
ncbi:Dps family protein [Massilia endophytica]|uniref:Dps family protein n=1 Tax=Massilia endophytica TaxID=2899220 RepID=UPI001E385852|nr:DNA starvation/stationary phase protection protein [Massilia endophytica]UGQ47894.1 DNA starvation/stationary phase protection protein [Massilia endophytica]